MAHSNEWISTRFLYKRDAQLCAEIEIIELEPSHYKFVIHPAMVGRIPSTSGRTPPLRSVPLPFTYGEMNRVYSQQLDCLRAAIQLMSSINLEDLTIA